MTPSQKSLGKVSIIIPVFNAELYLKETLGSAINQTYQDIEIICVNDGSTDNSIKVLEEYQNRIKIINQKNTGQCAASNLGLQHAKGDYIKFLDADDVINSKHIELQINRLNRRQDALASCEWGRFFDSNPNSAKFIPESVWRDMKSLDWIISALSQKSDMMPAWLWLIPKKIIKKAGGWNEKLSLNNDFEFSIRLLLKSKEVLFTRDAKLYYRSGQTNNLASSFSKDALQSALLTTDLGCQYILDVQNNNIIKQLLANRYQQWIYRIYPNHKSLLKILKRRVDSLGGSNIGMDGGKIFKTLTKFFGWKFSKRLQLLSYKLGYKPALRHKTEHI